MASALDTATDLGISSDASDFSADLTSLYETQADVATQLETQTASYDALQEDLATQFASTQTLLSDYATAAQEGLAEYGTIDTTASDAFQATVQEQITSLQNSYGVQVQTQAKQIDALVGQGAFAGNAYRAQQAYASSMQSLTSAALGEVADYTISAASTLSDISLSEQSLALEGQATYMTQLGQAAELTMNAASVYTGQALEIKTGKTSAITTLLGLQASLAESEASFDMASKELFNETQLSILQNETSYQIAAKSAAATKYAAKLSYKASQAATEASIAIANIQADTAIEQQEIASSASLSSVEAQLAALEEA